MRGVRRSPGFWRDQPSSRISIEQEALALALAFSFAWKKEQQEGQEGRRWAR